MRKVHGYTKNPDTGVVINTNMDQLAQYRSDLAKLKRQSTLETRINNMENDLSEIKNLLQRLLNNG